MDAARQVIHKVKPDVILVSLSSFGVGVDEALLATAEVKTFALQDFWGDVNPGLGKSAGVYFVTDDYAAGLTRKRWGVTTEVVGSPKHQRYQDLDVPALRGRTRKLLGLDAADSLVSFFGQSPSIPGHEAMFKHFLRSLRKIAFPALRLLVRSHPKHPEAQTAYESAAGQNGFTLVHAKTVRTVEGLLAASDLVVTAFSTCGVDHAHLSSHSPVPIGCVLYLMNNRRVHAFFRDTTGLQTMPILKMGIGCACHDAARLPALLRRTLHPSAAVKYHRASRRLVAGDPARKIIRTLWRAAGANHE